MFILEFKTDSADFNNIYSGKSDELQKMFATFRTIQRVISAIWNGSRGGELTDRTGKYIGRWEFN